MRIERRQENRRHEGSLEEKLDNFLQFGGHEERPCGSACQKVCPTCGSVSCQCQCAPDCEHIPTALSSDPENYPIEESIAPLVYTLKAIGHFQPCWSCEGHMDVRGDRIWKIPRVWFYCNSTLHLRLLGDVLQEFAIEHVTGVPWIVKLTFSDDDNPDTTFSLRPDPASIGDVSLADLQNDARMLAKRLPDALRARAKKIRKSLSKPSQ